MDCTTARERLLDAPLEELRAGNGSALARHLDTCTGCRAAAARILAAMHALDREHGTLPQRGALEPAVARALAAATAGPARRHFRRAIWTAPLAAAAALLLYLSGGQPPPHQPSLAALAATLPPVPEPPASCVVNAPADGVIAVLNTADPRITIVWYF